MCSNTYQPEVERSIEPGQTQKAFGTDIPVSNATGNERSFRAMMRPDTHILVNIFNRVSDRRDVREIRSRVHDRTNRPTRHFHPTITSWRDVPVCVYFNANFISIKRIYLSHSSLPHGTLSNNIVAGHHSILSCEIFFKSRMCMRVYTRNIRERMSREYREALSQDKRKEILNCAVDETSVCVAAC